MEGELLLVDTYSLFFRAFHALPPMATRAGEPTGALYGFSALLLKLVRERRPAGIAFAVDVPGGTFRSEAYAQYKGTRAAVPGPLAAQLLRLPALLGAWGAPVLACPGFEADDVLATLAREAREAGRAALVVSGDRDLLQTARGATRVLFVGRRGREAVVYDEAAVRARFGVPPEELPSLVALVGDPADNLPGVPGVGPRRAAAWVREGGGVAGVLARLDALEPRRLRPAVRERAQRLLENERLARLRDDVPLAPGERAAPLGAPGRERLRALFAELEFRSLLPRLDALAG